MFVCVCNAVTDREILQAADEGATSVSDLSDALNVATCCGRCETCARKLLKEAHSRQSATDQNNS